MVWENLKMAKVVAYLRVSTQRQGESGLGIEAQHQAIATYCQHHDATLVATYTEVGSGKKNDRAELARAIAHCRMTGATLLVAKMDRLSRNAHALLGIADSGIDLVATDMPHANRLTVGIMALVAEQEAMAISQRTKSALAALLARGVKLGRPVGTNPTPPDYRAGAAARVEKADAYAESLRDLVSEIARTTVSLNGIATALAQKGIMTPRGTTRWHAQTVKNLMARLAA